MLLCVIEYILIYQSSIIYDRYAAVTVPGLLQFYKDQVSLDQNAINSDTLDTNTAMFPKVNLSLVLRITVVGKGNSKKDSYLDVELGDETIHLK